MKTLAILAVAVGAIAVYSVANMAVDAASVTAESSFDKTLAVSGPVTMSVSTGAGAVHVHAGLDNQVHIVAHVRANDSLSQSEAQSRVQQIAANPPIHQMGSTISVGPEHNDPLYRNVSVEYDVTTPKQTSLNAQSGSGSVDVADLAEPVNAQSGSGSVNADNVGGKVRLQTGSGSIHARGIAGDADIQTGSGSIELQQTAPGDVWAHTGSGSIHLDGAQKSLQAETGSGSITVAGNPGSDWKLQTGSGGVELALGSAARFTLDAQAGSGGIHLAQPITMQGSINNHHVSGTVNGGGPTLHIQTGSGDIRIQ